MKTISDYTINCTEEQTKKALKLGAPLEIYSEEYDNSNIKDNEFYITNDIIFMNNENICRNEEFDLVCIIGEKPNRKAYFVPTAEQMRVWLESQGFYFRTNTIGSSVEINFVCIYEDNSICYPEGILAAIDAALDYLKNKK